MAIDFNPWFIITTLGDPRLWVSLCTILFFIRLYYRQKVSPYNRKFLWVCTFIIFAGFAMASSLAFTEVLKYTFQVPRICTIETNPYCLNNYSFPSGHAAVAFTAFSGIYFILNRRKYFWVFIFPALVGISRLALGVHTIQDVVAGSGVGMLVFLIYYWTAKKSEFIGRWVKN